MFSLTEFTRDETNQCIVGCHVNTQWHWQQEKNLLSLIALPYISRQLRPHGASGREKYCIEFTKTVENWRVTEVVNISHVKHGPELWITQLYICQQILPLVLYVYWPRVSATKEEMGKLATFSNMFFSILKCPKILPELSGENPIRYRCIIDWILTSCMTVVVLPYIISLIFRYFNHKFAGSGQKVYPLLKA